MDIWLENKAELTSAQTETLDVEPVPQLFGPNLPRNTRSWKNETIQKSHDWNTEE